MPTTSPDSLRSPNPTDPYNLVSDLAIMNTDVQAALVRRANSYIGTSAQRAAFTTAPEGTHWQDTNSTRALYVRQSSAWVEIWSPAPASWVSLTPVSPWVADATYPPAYKIQNGIVYFRGRVSGSIANSTMFNLPVGARPTFLSFYVLERGSATLLSRVTVDPSGAFVHSSTTATAAGNAVSLNGVVFPNS